MSLIAHAGGIFFGFLPALVVYLTKGTESSFVKEESREALNFQITLAIAYVVASVLVVVLIGLLLLPIIWIASVIMMIMAAVAVNNGTTYRYPVNLRLLK
ncbi:MAG TPA: DUF4870 domain-containing protein [Acidimicrobiales bacterium]|nr:DUF4870 domain-containing protein [Acidimicrobiales bacterium]